ncbi:hypothetical protein J4466_01445 [Candidatus Pacearchaeota archaeon]|nr:hypothetical protein [Candidatus Pacearchaeota archaeon]
MRNIEPRYELDIVEKSVKGFVYFCIGASLFCLGGLIGSQRAIGIYMEILNEERERLRAISEIYDSSLDNHQRIGSFTNIESRIK